MKNRCGYNRFMALGLLLLLCGVMQWVRAQEFTVNWEHVPVQIAPDSGISMRYGMTPLSHAVKYHGYYFLKLNMHYQKENPTKWWDESILVAVSEKDKTSRDIIVWPLWWISGSISKSNHLLFKSVRSINRTWSPTVLCLYIMPNMGVRDVVSLTLKATR